MRSVAIIPVYNHPSTIESMVDAVNLHGLKCILVDDGSDLVCASVLDRLAKDHKDSVRLVRLSKNQGKGGAMMAGFYEAVRLGYSHALQIDADGQHDARDIPHFLDISLQNPNSVILGCPIYDLSIPKIRLYPRYATHFWVWINTLSFEITDSMCGFRVYPLLPVIELIDNQKVGLRMDFDCEVLVRLHWRGVRMINYPTKVTYPLDGISHFQIWTDNVLISRMHAILFLGMLRRLPRLLWRKLAS